MEFLELSSELKKKKKLFISNMKGKQGSYTGSTFALCL